jgi:1-acyl-sn-glycerol-3-phosphate acyltransferase
LSSRRRDGRSLRPLAERWFRIDVRGIENIPAEGGALLVSNHSGTLPCSVVGAEEIYPPIANVPTLARVLGVPYVPVTPFFPWLGLLGLVPLPSKWLIEFGEPIRADALGDGASEDPMLVFHVTDQVRETIQQTLYSLLMQRRGVFS